MAIIARSSVSLRFRNADFAAVSEALGAATNDGAKMPGLWLRQVPAREPGDPDAQVTELLAGLNSDFRAWRQIAQRFEGHIFCGIFVQDGNQGFALRHETLTLLAERGIGFEFDVYAV